MQVGMGRDDPGDLVQAACSLNGKGEEVPGRWDAGEGAAVLLMERGDAALGVEALLLLEGHHCKAMIVVNDVASARCGLVGV